MRKIVTTIVMAGLVWGPVSVFAAGNDTDGDGIVDEVEDANKNGIVDSGETDPLNADTDGGGEADGSELLNKRNPFLKEDDFTYDSDGDGLNNGREAALQTDPKNADSDRDGVRDSDDAFPLDPDFAYDADYDDIADEWETRHRLSPTTNDAEEDADKDGLSNVDEFIQNTDPLQADTDRDGVVDGQEVDEGGNPEESACLSYTNGSLPTLTDIADHWAKRHIEILQGVNVSPENRAIVEGYVQPDQTRTFMPDKPITRFELLKLALLSNCIHLYGDAEKPAITFTDLPFASRPREADDRILRRQVVYTAVKHGIVQGYEDGTFRPDDAITRAEALKIILKASRLPELFGIDNSAPMSKTFTDVDMSGWYVQYLAQALTLDLIAGYEDGSFRPGASITRAEAAKLIHVSLIGNPGVNSQIVPAE